jgi:RimJ/RimL family protein N-acetyltransferase
MKIHQKEYVVNGLRYIVRSAEVEDAKALSEVRVIIDGETENLDREQGEGFIDELGFRQIITEDTGSNCNIFIVAEVNGNIVGFSRCEGNKLRRLSHKVDFGVCILKEFWGYGIGKNFLKETVEWADSNQITKISLAVLETNSKAIELYKRYGFEVEGVLRKDKRLSDGNYYDTILMGRIHRILIHNEE